MKRSASIAFLGATVAALTLTACSHTTEETADKARDRGFSLVTTREPRFYGGYASVPVDIGSAKCAADFVAADGSSDDAWDYLTIYGPDGRVLTSVSGEKIYNPYPDSIRKLSQTAVCYREDTPSPQPTTSATPQSR